MDESWVQVGREGREGGSIPDPRCGHSSALVLGGKNDKGGVAFHFEGFSGKRKLLTSRFCRYRGGDEQRTGKQSERSHGAASMNPVGLNDNQFPGRDLRYFGWIVQLARGLFRQQSGS